MSKRRWMPLYVADYIADTGHLSTVEHGAYLLLIMHYWQNGALPDDDRKLARICRQTISEWDEIKPTLAGLFDDGWTHKRIDNELTHAEHVMNKRSAAGKASAAARYGKPSSPVEQVLDHVNQQTHAHQDVHVEVDQEPISRDKPARKPAPESGCRLEFTMTFWPAYPHKVGRRAAIHAFIAARQRADLDPIMVGLQRYIRDKPPDRQWLNPATFLNQERYSDEPAELPSKNGKHPAGAVRSSAEIHTAALARAVNRRAGERERQAQPNGGLHGDDGTIAVDFREVGRPTEGADIGAGGGKGQGH